MMQAISHQQAQIYIHAAADTSLRPDEKAFLEAHLLGCTECRAYEKEFADLEMALRKTLGHRWNVSPRPLSLDRVLGWQKAFSLQRALSTATISVLVTLLILFTVTLARGGLFSRVDPATALEAIVATTVPTPSMQLTQSNTAIAKCTNTIYTVLEGDTLDSISATYSISKEVIIEYNRLESEQLTPFTYLILPLCDNQLTLTPSTTLTYTPSIPVTSLTP